MLAFISDLNSSVTSMANSTLRAEASFLSLRPRMCIPLLHSEQVRILHWQIRSDPLCDEEFRVLRLAETDFAGTPRMRCCNFRYRQAAQRQLGKPFFQHPVDARSKPGHHWYAAASYPIRVPFGEMVHNFFKSPNVMARTLGVCLQRF